MKGIVISIGIALIGAAIAIGLSQAGLKEERETDRIERKISDPALKALRASQGSLEPGGQKRLEAELKKLKGRPVVINIWASWCGPCKMEAPFFTEAAKAYGDRVGFLGVNLQDGSVPAERFIKQYNLPFPSIEDLEGEVYDRYKLRGAPSSILINRQGQSYVHTGAYASKQDLDKEIEEKALGAKQKQTERQQERR